MGTFDELFPRSEKKPKSFWRIYTAIVCKVKIRFYRHHQNHETVVWIFCINTSKPICEVLGVGEMTLEALPYSNVISYNFWDRRFHWFQLVFRNLN